MELAAINDVSVFAEHIGSRFRIEIRPDEFVDAKLVEAEAVSCSTQNMEAPPNKSFSLLFALPEGVDLEQRIYTVSQEKMGELPLFLVPVGPGRMESVFN